jgi:large subunit ribosomal protein L9
VTATDLADEIWRVAKIRVDRRKIDLGEPIKKIGRYAVPVELFTDVTVEVATLVVPEGGELDESPVEEQTAGAAETPEPAEAPETEQ